jgi:hypothetical protein
MSKVAAAITVGAGYRQRDGLRRAAGHSTYADHRECKLLTATTALALAVDAQRSSASLAHLSDGTPLFHQYAQRLIARTMTFRAQAIPYRETGDDHPDVRSPVRRCSQLDRGE